MYTSNCSSFCLQTFAQRQCATKFTIRMYAYIIIYTYVCIHSTAPLSVCETFSKSQLATKFPIHNDLRADVGKMAVYVYIYIYICIHSYIHI